MYDQLWPTYTQIPADVRERWFQKWALKFIWDAEHNIIIGKIYDHQVTKRYNEGFKYCILTNIANRASSRSSRYTGGSATFMKMKTILSKSLDREATLVKTFNYTHILKENKEGFADERSVTHYRLEVATQQSQPPSGADEAGSETFVVNPNKIWRETSSELYKNRRFGLGSFFISGIRSSALAASSMSAFAASPADLQEVIKLRDELQKLIQELHQQTEQSEQRYRDILACVAISSDLIEKLEQLNRLR
ncbi:hypothetical protein Ahy_A01g000295 [Arachis hypogaea]|uniref:Uncharacterized protein n=1 Tax=Arachis hypogaea TaxID=3818 RepID=A0A445EJS7_ARAHY|nr:hypothetical protein Ahy_A01g000295 [Arachis hypogaea]